MIFSNNPRLRQYLKYKEGEGEMDIEGATTEEVTEISLAAKRQWELQIRTLQKTPRDPEKLIKILKIKQKDYERAEDSEDIERLVPEIEMVQFVLFLVSRNNKTQLLF